MNEQKVKFTNSLDQSVWVDRSEIQFRPSSYAIVTHEQKLLVTEMRTNQRVTLPGGGVDPGETLQEALIREIKEETGLNATVGDQILFQERNFYYEPASQAWQAYVFIFDASVDSVDLSPFDPDDENAEVSRWVDIGGLHPTDFQFMGEEIVRYLHSHNN